MATETDRELVEAFLAGNQIAFEILVERYLKPVYNFVRRLSGRSEEAADITQDVFLKVWKKIHSFKLEQNFKTWIFTIARNTTIDWFRKRKSVLFSVLDTDEAKFEDTLADPEPLPPELLERREIAHELETALEKLLPEQREVVLLHDMDGMTFEEIASVVGRPMNTVKSRYRRAIFALRELLSRIR